MQRKHRSDDLQAHRISEITAVAATTPSKVASAEIGATAASEMMKGTKTPVIMAKIASVLARSTRAFVTGADAIRSGASSPEMASQARLPANSGRDDQHRRQQGRYPSAFIEADPQQTRRAPAGLLWGDSSGRFYVQVAELFLQKIEIDGLAEELEGAHNRHRPVTTLQCCSQLPLRIDQRRACSANDHSRAPAHGRGNGSRNRFIASPGSTTT
jgi:hypothetical protein